MASWPCAMTTRRPPRPRSRYERARGLAARAGNTERARGLAARAGNTERARGLAARAGNTERARGLAARAGNTERARGLGDGRRLPELRQEEPGAGGRDRNPPVRQLPSAAALA